MKLESRIKPSALIMKVTSHHNKHYLYVMVWMAYGINSHFAPPRLVPCSNARKGSKMRCGLSVSKVQIAGNGYLIPVFSLGILLLPPLSLHKFRNFTIFWNKRKTHFKNIPGPPLPMMVAKCQQVSLETIQNDHQLLVLSHWSTAVRKTTN